jgi:peptidoglycan/LPS O-acetylase OafA/YrhL
MGDSSNPPPRYHAFDSLRAVMMLLGVVLHSCHFYLVSAKVPGVQFQDRNPSRVCDMVLFGIHTFRMQVFFVMAGFFAALLCARRGPGGMMRHRFHRVILPLVLGWLILFPPTISAFLYGCAERAGQVPGAAVLRWWQTGQIAWIDGWKPVYSLLLISPWHLWFLYALVWFYLGSLIFLAVGRLGKGAVGRAVNGVYRRLLTTGLILPVSIAATFLTLLLCPLGLFSQEFPLFIPNPLALLCFGLFFGFGWMLHRNVDLLPRFQRRPIALLLVAALLLVIYLGRLDSLFDPGTQASAKPVIAATGSAIAWLCVFGLIGLFSRFFERPDPVMRYVSDSAYWVYLAHLPLLYWLQVLMYGLPVPGLLKALMVLVVASVILFVSYDLAVRSTVIGQFLNGRRYPPARLALRPAFARRGRSDFGGSRGVSETGYHPDRIENASDVGYNVVRVVGDRGGIGVGPLPRD